MCRRRRLSVRLSVRPSVRPSVLKMVVTPWILMGLTWYFQWLILELFSNGIWYDTTPWDSKSQSATCEKQSKFLKSWNTTNITIIIIIIINIYNSVLPSVRPCAGVGVCPSVCPSVCLSVFFKHLSQNSFVTQLWIFVACCCFLWWASVLERGKE